jgi:hypothetical protein
MERKPIRTRLQNRVIKGSAIAPSTITAEEVDFGTALVTSDNPADVIDTPKEGLLIVDPTTNSASVYSEAQGDYVTIQDAAAVAIAQGKSKTYVQNDEPTGGTYSLGDLWIDTNDGNKLYAYSGSAWAAKQDGAISTAQSTADGKNKVNYSTSDPGSTANTAGDIWFKYASGIVIAQYVGAGGTTWTSTTIGNTVIANLDAGKITTGYIDVAGSVKITTSATASGTGGTTARIEINSTGFYAYDGSVATVSITNTGTAVFSGTVNATAGAFTGYVTAGTARFGANVDSTYDGIWIDANNYWYDTGAFKVGDGTESMSYSSAGGLVVTGEINANSGTFSGTITASGTISGGTISGATITGGTVRTAATGRRIEITSTGSGAIYFYDANSTYNGVISSTDYGMYFYGPGSDLGLGAKMVLYSDENPTSALAGLAAINSGGTGDVTLNTATNTLRVDGATAAVSLSASTPVTTYGLRNVRGFTIFDPATNSTGVDGDIAVVYS